MVKLPDNMSPFSQSPRSRKRKGRVLFKILVYPMYWMYSIKLWKSEPNILYLCTFVSSHQVPSPQKSVCIFWHHWFQTMCINHTTTYSIPTNLQKQHWKAENWNLGKSRNTEYLLAHRRNYTSFFTSSILISGTAHDHIRSGWIDLKVLGYHCVCSKGMEDSFETDLALAMASSLLEYFSSHKFLPSFLSDSH